MRPGRTTAATSCASACRSPRVRAPPGKTVRHRVTGRRCEGLDLGAVVCFGDGREFPSCFTWVLWGGLKGVLEMRHSVNNSMPTLDLLCTCPESFSPCLPWVPWGRMWGSVGWLGDGALPCLPILNLLVCACPGCHGELWGWDTALGPSVPPPPPDAVGRVWGAVGCCGPPMPPLDLPHACPGCWRAGCGELGVCGVAWGWALP